MTLVPFSCLPRRALLNLGGFTIVRPDAWRRYLSEVIQDRFQDRNEQDRAASPSWQENDCVLKSIEQYMMVQYGVVVPEDNLFRFYNPAGEGISVGQMLEAISSIIEPLGCEIDLALVRDDELRSGFGKSPKLVGMEQAGAFDARPGICMINIHDGYSHAFFWQRMDPKKFEKEQFRMALMISRTDGCQAEQPSPVESVLAFSQYLQSISDTCFDKGEEGLQGEINAFCGYLSGTPEQCSSFFPTVQVWLDTILTHLSLAVKLRRDEAAQAELECALEAGASLRRILGNIYSY
jgi:hypothetical protein